RETGSSNVSEKGRLGSCLKEARDLSRLKRGPNGVHPFSPIRNNDDDCQNRDCRSGYSVEFCWVETKYCVGQFGGRNDSNGDVRRGRSSTYWKPTYLNG